MEARSVARSSSPSIAIAAPERAATARSVSAKATSGWNAADLRPRGHRGLEHLGAQRAARVDHRLAAVHPEGRRQRCDRIVGYGDDDELDLVHQGLRLGERARRGHERPEPFAPRRITRRDGRHGPTGPSEGHPERRADRARSHDPDDRRLARLAVLVRVNVVVWRPVRVEVDPAGGQLGDGRRSLGGVARHLVRLIADAARPGLHGAPTARVGSSGYASIERVYR